MPPITTTVADTLYAPDGTLPTGKLLISTVETFTSADGYVILQGFTLETPVVDGVFSVNLIPNQGTTPTSTYSVAVQVTSGFFDQVWSVPSSLTPVNLAAVIVS